MKIGYFEYVAVLVSSVLAVHFLEEHAIVAAKIEATDAVNVPFSNVAVRIISATFF